LGYPVLQIPKQQHETFRKFLEEFGFTFEDRPYQVFLARKPGSAVNLYTNGKIVFGGTDESTIKIIHEHAIALGASTIEKPERKLKPLEVSGTRIGTDEVGKGDYFGPLVVAGVLANNEVEKQLKELGIKDSKSLSDTTISNLAYETRRICGRKRFEEVWINPLKYNILYEKMKNINRILGWAHARVIENLLANGIDCHKAIADQFGDPAYIKHALMAKGKQIELIQIPKAERDIAVAAASVLARDVFIRKLEELGDSYLMKFPKGSTHVIEFGKKLVQIHGMSILGNVAKLHFRTTSQITNGFVPAIPNKIGKTIDFQRVPREATEKDIQDARLECYNLISTFEIEFRGFMKSELSKHFGVDWWEECIPEIIRKKCQRLVEIECKKGRKVELVDCLDFSHYQEILTREPNWSNVFRKFFGNKQRVMAGLTLLKDIRDPVSHARGKITLGEKNKVITAIQHLKKLMRPLTNLEHFSENV